MSIEMEPTPSPSSREKRKDRYDLFPWVQFMKERREHVLTQLDHAFLRQEGRTADYSFGSDTDKLHEIAHQMLANSSAPISLQCPEPGIYLAVGCSGYSSFISHETGEKGYIFLDNEEDRIYGIADILYTTPYPSDEYYDELEKCEKEEDLASIDADAYMNNFGLFLGLRSPYLGHKGEKGLEFTPITDGILFFPLHNSGISIRQVTSVLTPGFIKNRLY